MAVVFAAGRIFLMLLALCWVGAWLFLLLRLLLRLLLLLLLLSVVVRGSLLQWRWIVGLRQWRRLVAPVPALVSVVAAVGMMRHRRAVARRNASPSHGRSIVRSHTWVTVAMWRVGHAHVSLARIRSRRPSMVVWRIPGVRRGCVHRTRWCPARMWRVVRRACIRRVVCVSVARRAHRASRNRWDAALLVDGRLRVHALLWPDVPKLRVVGRLYKARRRLR